MSVTKKPDLARHSKDVGSTEVQVANITSRITYLTEHLKINKKDNMARRGLMQLVGQRRKLLKYLAAKDEAAYLKAITTLGLRK